MVAISFLVTDRLRYVMIVSIPDTIRHQELERKLFLKKTYCEVLHLKLRAIIARERLQNEFRDLRSPDNDKAARVFNSFFSHGESDLDDEVCDPFEEDRDEGELAENGGSF